jgi:hypothetical protein
MCRWGGRQEIYFTENQPTSMQRYGPGIQNMCGSNWAKSVQAEKVYSLWVSAMRTTGEAKQGKGQGAGLEL